MVFNDHNSLKRSDPIFRFKPVTGYVERDSSSRIFGDRSNIDIDIGLEVQGHNAKDVRQMKNRHCLYTNMPRDIASYTPTSIYGFQFILIFDD